MSSNNTDTGDTTIMATTSTSVQDFGAGEELLQETPRLTAHEIQLACERAGVFTQDPNNPNTVINIGSQVQALQLQPTIFGRIREIIHSTALFSGVIYAVYLFWKKFIAPYLFGKPKRKPVEEVLEDIDKKVETRTEDLNKEISVVKDLITSQQRDHAQQLNREFSNFRSDLDAIKGLLLNRKQFASPVAPVTVPSIPAWQLASSPHHHHLHSPSDDNEKGDDAGSGSGSSETEVVTKNSDSSLEIM
ncbi:GL12812 [Drosophila persimilis]|uniref:Peroxisomal membrane protein PEX14 n=1 Tax=Drosophila persimilis TaxID=7234 RepID=B4H7S1_DROPE|nr:GL12812 [Drosophila persimilis]